jgi:chromosome segregation ATPase
MATEEIAIKITTDSSQTEKSVGSIRKELREATQDAVSLARKFGELSPEALNAAQKVANLKDEFGDLKDRIDALNPDAKFRAFSTALQGVAGGFAGVQGAIGLFGTESEELERQLLKVQSALALSEGLNSVLQSKDAFLNLGAIIKTKVVTAFSTLRGAIIATGLGALVVALGTIVAYWDEISEAIGGASKETKAYSDAQKEVNDDIAKANENLLAVSNAFQAARNGAISKSEALDIYNEKLGNTIGRASTLEQAESIYKANSANYIKAITARATAQVLLAKAAQAAAKAATGEDADLSWWDQAVVVVAQAVGGIGLASQEVVKRAAQNRQENQANLNLYQGLALTELEKAGEAEAKMQAVAVANGTSIVKAGVKAQTSAKKQGLTEQGKDRKVEMTQEEKDAQTKKELDAKNLKELQDLNTKTAEENRLAKLSEFQRDIEELTNEYNDRITMAKEFNIDIDAITEEYTRKSKERQAEQDMADFEAQLVKDAEAIAKTEGDYENDIAILDAQKQRILATEEDAEGKRTKLLEENAKARTQIDNIEFEGKQNNIKKYSELLGGFSELAGKQTGAGKALAVAEATINTFLAASQVMSAKSPQFIVNPFLRFTTAALTIATGLKNVKSILSVKVPGGGGGASGSVPSGGGAGSVSAPTQAPISSSFTPTQTNSLQNSAISASNDAQPIKAFVVESDMTDSQDRIAKIKSAATL